MGLGGGEAEPAAALEKKNVVPPIFSHPASPPGLLPPTHEKCWEETLVTKIIRLAFAKPARLYKCLHESDYMNWTFFI